MPAVIHPLGSIPAWAHSRLGHRAHGAVVCVQGLSPKVLYGHDKFFVEQSASPGADVVESRCRCGVRWVPFASRGAEYGASRCAVGEADGGADGRLTAGADGRAAQDDGGAAGDARRWPVPFIRFAAALAVAAACVGGSGWPVALASGGARVRVRALTYACVRTSPPLPTRRSRRAKATGRLATVAHARAWRPRRSRLEEDCIEVGVLSFGSAAVDSAAGRHRDWTVLGVEPGSTGRRCAFTAHRNCSNHSAASVRPIPCKPGQNVCQGYEYCRQGYG